MSTAKRVLPVAFVALVLSSASGCSQLYYFNLTVTVLSAADGSPVTNATLTPEFSHGSHNKADGGPAVPGSHTKSFTRSSLGRDDTWRDQRWNVMVESDGFVPQVIDVKPDARPMPGSTTALNKTVRLEPVKAP